jgi:hypothetical protein
MAGCPRHLFDVMHQTGTDAGAARFGDELNREQVKAVGLIAKRHKANRALTAPNHRVLFGLLRFELMPLFVPTVGTSQKRVQVGFGDRTNEGPVARAIAGTELEGEFPRPDRLD